MYSFWKVILGMALEIKIKLSAGPTQQETTRGSLVCHEAYISYCLARQSITCRPG